MSEGIEPPAGTSSIWDTIKARASDPFLGSFIFAVLGLHWPFFYELAAGEGAADKTLKKAYKLAVPIGSDAWFSTAGKAFVVALLYTLLWPHVRGVVRELHGSFDLFWENRLRERRAQQLKETSSTLFQRPEWIALEAKMTAIEKDLSERLSDMQGFASQLWNGDAGGGNGHPFEVCEISTPLSPEDVPIRVRRDPLNNQRVFPSTPSELPDNSMLGIYRLGRRHLVCVPHGAKVPWLWGDAALCTFDERGIACIPLPGTALWPRIQRTGTSAFGVFRATEHG